jgi:exonuclease SbcD
MLDRILEYADSHYVDCVLVAGDLFDSAAPPPDAEELAYRFFSRLHALGIPAVVIAGNHDHPRRIEAVAPLLRALNVHAVGRPSSAEQGGVVDLRSRDGTETAIVAALPWVTEREAIERATLQQEPGQGLTAYAEGVRFGLETLCQAFRPETVNVVVAHLFVDDAQVGAGGGERPLSVSLGIFGVPRQMLPTGPQYIALGHVHRPQAVRPSPPAWYSGSPLQQDFGETRQEKFVNLVEIHPGRPAEVTHLPMTEGRALLDVGTSAHGIHLADLPAWADRVGDAWLRVFVEADAPVANLPAEVRAILPNAVHVERVRHDVERPSEPTVQLGPEELFAAFYRSPQGQGREPDDQTTRLFRELLREELEAPLATA